MSTHSVTETRSFKHCRRQWDYSWTQDLEPRVETYGATWFGSAIHAALAAWYTREIPDLVGNFESQVNEVAPDELIDLGISMLQRYEPYALEKDDWEVLDAEKRLLYELPSGNVLTGTMDLLVMRQGRIWVVDHKTYKTFATDADLELDDQMMLYMLLVTRNFPGEEIGGVILNQLRKKIPSIPTQLKGGGLSRAQLDTTAEVYTAEIVRLGLDPADYEDMLGKLVAKDAEYFKRLFIRRDTRAIDAFELEVDTVVKEMQSPAIYPNRTNFCFWGCSYQSLCRAESLGGDADSIKQSFYRKRDER